MPLRTAIPRLGAFRPVHWPTRVLIAAPGPQASVSPFQCFIILTNPNFRALARLRLWVSPLLPLFHLRLLNIPAGAIGIQPVLHFFGGRGPALGSGEFNGFLGGGYGVGGPACSGIGQDQVGIRGFVVGP